MFIRALFLVSLFASSASATAMKEVNHCARKTVWSPFRSFRRRLHSNRF